MENYKKVCHFVRTSQSHGGVCIYSKTNIECSPINEINTLATEEIAEISAAYFPTFNSSDSLLQSKRPSRRTCRKNNRHAGSCL